MSLWRNRRAIALSLAGAVVVVSACGSAGKTTRPAVPATTASSTSEITTPSTASTTTTTDASQNPRVHVAVLLPTPTLVSGRRVDATLVVRNETGEPITSTACQTPGEAVLGQIGLTPYPPPTSTTSTTTTPTTTTGATTFPPLRVDPGGPCLGPRHVMVGPGTTRVAFELEASSSLCQLAPAAQLQVDPCLPGGTPLRPGSYYVELDWLGHLPTPIIVVPVVAAPH